MHLEPGGGLAGTHHLLLVCQGPGCAVPEGLDSCISHHMSFP